MASSPYGPDHVFVADRVPGQASPSGTAFSQHSYKNIQVRTLIKSITRNSKTKAKRLQNDIKINVLESSIDFAVAGVRPVSLRGRP